MKYWQPEIETISKSDLEKLQSTRLRQTLERASHSPFYRKVFAENKILPDAIRTLEDLKNLPFTTKEDLRDNYPYDMAAIPLKSVYAYIRPAVRQVIRP
jgi:phenylacetate-CoA ligase